MHEIFFHDNALVEVMDDQYAVCENADVLLVITEWNQFRNPDFSKLKSLLQAPIILTEEIFILLQRLPNVDLHIFVSGAQINYQKSVLN